MNAATIMNNDIQTLLKEAWRQETLEADDALSAGWSDIHKDLANLSYRLRRLAKRYQKEMAK